MITFDTGETQPRVRQAVKNYPHFHISSGTTILKDVEEPKIDEELLQKYQQLAMNIELSKTESKTKKAYIPSYAKLEVITLFLLSIFAIIFTVITGLMGNTSISTYFLIIGLGCLVGFLPLLYAIRKVV